MFNPIQAIIAKRDGGKLTPETIRNLIHAYTADAIPDYQMSALLMAIFLRGMDAVESAALTEAMLHSGIVVDLSDTPGIKVDKHSTGGVGDKTSIILAPIVAACGVPVPMISGRGLGHTGGTLDKLESIPGFRVDLDLATYRALIERHGIALIGQTAEIAPADKRLYALRDVTGTVECIPLIAASIMSKKLAEGIDALVLDVKTGKGAFMQRLEDSRLLAETLTGIGARAGKNTVAWITRMDEPLGRAAGNWVEIAECIACLRGEDVPDLMEVTYALAAEMLYLGGAVKNFDEGLVMAREAIRSGRAFDKLVEITEAQGGNTQVLLRPETRTDIPAPIQILTPENTAAYVSGIDARAIGMTVVAAGAGRMRKEDAVDPTAGVILHKKTGEHVSAGEPLASLYTHRTSATEELIRGILEAYSYSDTPPAQQPLLVERIEGKS